MGHACLSGPVWAFSPQPQLELRDKQLKPKPRGRVSQPSLRDSGEQWSCYSLNATPLNEATPAIGLEVATGTGERSP